jgi:hypothetical protein
MKPQEVELELVRAELEKALKLLSKTAAKRKGEDAVLSFDGANLHLDVGGVSIAVPAKGRCDCQIRISGKSLLQLAAVLPSGVKTTVKLNGGKLYINQFSMSCIVQPVWSKVIDLPINITNKQAVEKLQKMDAVDIRESGLADFFAAQQAKMSASAHKGLSKKQIEGQTPDLF